MGISFFEVLKFLLKMFPGKLQLLVHLELTDSLLALVLVLLDQRFLQLVEMSSRLSLLHDLLTQCGDINT
jgi:hypothetical protein